MGTIDTYPALMVAVGDAVRGFVARNLAHLNDASVMAASASKGHAPLLRRLDCHVRGVVRPSEWECLQIVATSRELAHQVFYVDDELSVAGAAAGVVGDHITFLTRTSIAYLLRKSPHVAQDHLRAWQSGTDPVILVGAAGASSKGA